MLHNHYEDGTSMCRYPLVQYKVIDQVPVLLGLNEGAELLTSLFLQIKEIEINGQHFPVYSKNISQQNAELGIADDLISYGFVNHWMALNSENHKEYLGLDPEAQNSKLNKVLRNNILSFYNEKFKTKKDTRFKTSSTTSSTIRIETL